MGVLVDDGYYVDYDGLFVFMKAVGNFKELSKEGNIVWWHYLNTSIFFTTWVSYKDRNDGNK